MEDSKNIKAELRIVTKVMTMVASEQRERRELAEGTKEISLASFILHTNSI